MSGKYSELNQNTIQNMKKMYKYIPEFMTHFGNMSKWTHQEGGALDPKTRELVAMALAVASHCPSCLGFHAESLVKYQGTREELMDVLGMAIYMGGGPSAMYAADAVQAYDEFYEKQKAETA